ncbi:MAG: bifunctional adenosylcobinamide kinase/adenosylcobinamide-phosphate guanylyltransferase [Gaiellaceae bacterium]
MPLTLLLGGARSGKSGLAVRMASAWPGPLVLVATAEAGDEEMAARIEHHRHERGEAWTTLEEPLELARALAEASPDAFLVVDCLTLWVANQLEAGRSEKAAEQAAYEAAALAAARASPTVVVSNEVGLGIVPRTPLGRSYRDLLGRVNAAFSLAADSAYLVVAGRTLELGRPLA